MRRRRPEIEKERSAVPTRVERSESDEIVDARSEKSAHPSRDRTDRIGRRPIHNCRRRLPRSGRSTSCKSDLLSDRFGSDRRVASRDGRRAAPRRYLPLVPSIALRDRKLLLGISRSRLRCRATLHNSTAVTRPAQTKQTCALKKRPCGGGRSREWMSRRGVGGRSAQRDESGCLGSVV